MELKQAVIICLIALFAAALVVLIARSLDMQAAAKLEPQLAKIAAELEALRKQGGLPPATGSTAESAPLDDGLIVYYFHNNTRCANCRAIESQAEKVVQTDFAANLKNGQLVWKVMNYETPQGELLAKRFEVVAPVVVLAKMKDGKIGTPKRLDRVAALVDEPRAFADYVRSEIKQMLPPPEDSSPSPPDDTSSIPAPEEEPTK
jgi:hypothetical protein